MAHYDLKSEFEPPYSTSGNVLIINEQWTALAIGDDLSYRQEIVFVADINFFHAELVATLTMMRHFLSLGIL